MRDPEELYPASGDVVGPVVWSVRQIGARMFGEPMPWAPARSGADRPSDSGVTGTGPVESGPPGGEPWPIPEGNELSEIGARMFAGR